MTRLESFGVDGREELALELGFFELVDEAFEDFGSTPLLPAHNVQGQPMLLPAFCIKYSK